MQPSCSCSSFLLGPITDWTKRHSGKKCIFSETSRPAVRSTQWWHLGFISSGQCGRSVRLSAHLCLVPTLRPHEPVTPLLLVPSRHFNFTASKRTSPSHTRCASDSGRSSKCLRCNRLGAECN